MGEVGRARGEGGGRGRARGGQDVEVPELGVDGAPERHHLVPPAASLETRNLSCRLTPPDCSPLLCASPACRQPLVSALGLRVRGLRCGIWGLGFEVYGEDCLARHHLQGGALTSLSCVPSSSCGNKPYQAGTSTAPQAPLPPPAAPCPPRPPSSASLSESSLPEIESRRMAWRAPPFGRDAVPAAAAPRAGAARVGVKSRWRTWSSGRPVISHQD